ncbi:hypothetical protein SAMN06298226_0873 [Nitrosovibrio sp. Nv4]|nr:hypothetical protein SAMN06298226_0873 [Nitrosovibrio sp. Nv4]
MGFSHDNINASTNFKFVLNSTVNKLVINYIRYSQFFCASFVQVLS